VLHDAEEIAARVVRMVQDGAVVSVTGKVIKMRTDTVCIHGDTPGAVDIARDLRKALEFSRKQLCRPLELRAAMSLARLLRDSGRAAEARDLLTPIHAAFTEGFAFADLQAAKTLLAELG